MINSGQIKYTCHSKWCSVTTIHSVLPSDGKADVYSRMQTLIKVFIKKFRARWLCEPLQRTHLQRPLLKMSPTDGDETSRGRKPENGRRRDFGRRRHRQSGFQYTYGPRPSSPELFNENKAI